MGTYDEMDASEIEATEACPTNEVQCFVREPHEGPVAVRIAYNAALDAAGTCQENP